MTAAGTYSEIQTRRVEGIQCFCHELSIGLWLEIKEHPVSKVPDEPHVELGAGFPDLEVWIDYRLHQVDGLICGVVGWIAVVG